MVIPFYDVHMYRLMPFRDAIAVSHVVVEIT